MNYIFCSPRIKSIFTNLKNTNVYVLIMNMRSICNKGDSYSTVIGNIVNTGYMMQGYRIHDAGYSIQDTLYRMHDTGYRIQDT